MPDAISVRNVVVSDQAASVMDRMVSAMRSQSFWLWPKDNNRHDKCHKKAVQTVSSTSNVRRADRYGKRQHRNDPRNAACPIRHCGLPLCCYVSILPNFEIGRASCRERVFKDV